MRIHNLALIACDSPETNDHQLRPYVDGDDWLAGDQLGLDPPKFLRQPALRAEGELIVGRCACGVIGCDDRTVIVERSSHVVIWRSESGRDLRFLQTDYDTEVERAANDFTWEPAGRTAERLVDNALLGKVTSDGYAFRWSSTRIRPDTLTLCFEQQGDQRLVHLAWNGKADDTVVGAALRAIPY